MKVGFSLLAVKENDDVEIVYKESMHIGSSLRSCRGLSSCEQVENYWEVLIEDLNKCGDGAYEIYGILSFSYYQTYDGDWDEDMQTSEITVTHVSKKDKDVFEELSETKVKDEFFAPDIRSFDELLSDNK
jgi:hypothetical protein